MANGMNKGRVITIVIGMLFILFPLQGYSKKEYYKYGRLTSRDKREMYEKEVAFIGFLDDVFSYKKQRKIESLFAFYSLFDLYYRGGYGIFEDENGNVYKRVRGKNEKDLCLSLYGDEMKNFLIGLLNVEEAEQYGISEENVYRINRVFFALSMNFFFSIQLLRESIGESTYYVRNIQAFDPDTTEVRELFFRQRVFIIYLNFLRELPAFKEEFFKDFSPSLRAITCDLGRGIDAGSITFIFKDLPCYEHPFWSVMIWESLRWVGNMLEDIGDPMEEFFSKSGEIDEENSKDEIFFEEKIFKPFYIRYKEYLIDGASFLGKNLEVKNLGGWVDLPEYFEPYDEASAYMYWDRIFLNQ